MGKASYIYYYLHLIRALLNRLPLTCRKMCSVLPLQCRPVRLQYNWCLNIIIHINKQLKQ